MTAATLEGKTTMQRLIEREDGTVTIESLGSGRKRVSVQHRRADEFVPVQECETAYPQDLIDKILAIKGSAWLCDEILREENSTVVENNIRDDVFPYFPRESFGGKRVLDFGCGAGASTAVLARLLPDASIVGVELQASLIEIARLRADHCGFAGRVEFHVSPDGNSLPAGIGTFDYIFLSAVYEHLMPEERVAVLPMLWRQLKPGGVLFVTETPYRWFPVEYHTTGGLFLLNYLPDRWALRYAQKFSSRGLQADDWSKLLRDGIRGGSPREILRLLSDGSSRPVILDPTVDGLTDRIDLWYAALNKSRHMAVKNLLFAAFKLIKLTTGVTMLPTLSLAIQKEAR